MNTLIGIIKNNSKQYGMIGALAFIMFLFQILTGGVLMRPINLTNLVLQNSYILVLAIGMLLVILTGNIDLSVGSVVAFVGAIAAVLMVTMKVHYIVAFIVCLLIGALIGAWQGYWIAYLKIPAFIVTLAGMLIFRGLALVVLKGQSLGPFPEQFQKMSSGFLSDHNSNGLYYLSIYIGLALSICVIIFEFYTRARHKKNDFEILPLWILILKLIFLVVIINYFSLAFALYKGFPNLFSLLFILFVVYTFFTNKTIMGRQLYALGGNMRAAKLSGVKTERALFWVFVNMGILAALAGMVFAARLNIASPKAGQAFELDAIAACYIGGASATGGIGTIIGAIVGGLVMGVLNNGMSILGVGIDWQQAIKGLVLLLAVAVDLYSKNKTRI